MRKALVYIGNMVMATANRKARKPQPATAAARTWLPGYYLVTRDAATRVGPTDLGRWVVKIVDCPGGVGIIGAIRTLNRLGELGPVQQAPAKWSRSKAGGGFVDRLGEQYLDWLAAAPGVTVAPYVAPEPMTKAEVLQFIGANPKACYRTLQASLVQRMGNATPTMAKFAGRELAKARPQCGYDCDDGCPVSGRCEG